LQLCIRLGEGEGSSAVRELRPGDSLEFDGPGGELIIPASQKPLVLIAGDTGIAPMRSIMLHFGATGDPRPVTILYETEGGELYPADFRQLAEARKITYETGLIEELIAGRRESLGDAAILAAGYQPFLLRVEDALRAAGIAVDAVRFESFGRL
jgi:NAD(P)H-flavin reductase